MNGPEEAVEFAHGYTYSGHPLAAAAGLAALDIYRDEQLFDRAKRLSSYWEDALHALRGVRHICDLRNLGLIGAIELEPRPNAPGARGYDALVTAFNRGALIRVNGDVISLSPPLIIEERQIDQLFETVRDVLTEIA
jgi:beta-alanine--pyruvate transaminase